MDKKKTVFVGVSGGVDSSVTAAMLMDQGYHVFGVFIRTWQPSWIKCTINEEKRDAMRVCATLDIPFIELDLSEEYRTEVADYMIDEYKKGRTPNPDVMCNKAVKFGHFLDFAMRHGADYIATGHYARNIWNEKEKRHELWRGIDTAKDQSYFLWTLTEEQLSKTIFPIGEIEKEKVRHLAERYNLPTAKKKDSQGICFIGRVDMKEFLSHYIDEKEGKVLDTGGGVIGIHPGALFFTLGERRGFYITEKGTEDRPYYVVSKDVEKNTITVSPDPHKTTESGPVILTHAYLRDQSPEQGKIYTAQIRYHGEHHPVEIKAIRKESTEIIFKEKRPLVAEGQSVVIYDGDRCVGGGIV